MRALGSIVYWTGLSLLAVLAIIGCLGFSVVCILAVCVGLTVFFIGLILLVLCCAPVACWCGIFDRSRWSKVLGFVNENARKRKTPPSAAPGSTEPTVA